MTNVTILNIKDIANTDYAFRGWNERTEKFFSLKDYTTVYVGSMVSTTMTTDDDYLALCENLFTMTNAGVLDGYYGHSLSVSDVVVVSSLKGTKYFYCDTFGWHRIDSLCS